MLKFYKVLTILVSSFALLWIARELLYFQLFYGDSIFIFWEDYIIVASIVYISITSILFSLRQNTIGNFLLINNYVNAYIIVFYNLINLVWIPFAISLTFDDARFYINPFLVAYGTAQLHFTQLRQQLLTNK